MGAADAQAVAHLLGISIAPSALVSALLEGTAPDTGVVVFRDGRKAGELPQIFELRDGARGLRLELRETKPATTRDLGTGTPPAGVRQAPLDTLALEPAED